MVPCLWRHFLAPCELGSLSLYVPPFHNRNNLGHPYPLGLGCNLLSPVPGAGTGSEIHGSGYLKQHSQGCSATLLVVPSGTWSVLVGSGHNMSVVRTMPERPVGTASWS